MKYFIHERNGVVVNSLSRPENTKVIELDSLPTIPDKKGFTAILRANFTTNKVWFELVESIEAVRERMIQRIDQYDTSPEINSFTLNGVSMWLNKATRTSLAYTIEVEAAAGQTTTRMWFDGTPPVSFDLPIDTLKMMLGALERYAKATYNVTQEHKAAIYGLETAQLVESYDYTAGYPEKLSL